MSGTSLDGIDAVLADLSDSQPRLLSRYYLPFDDALKGELLALHQPGHNELHRTLLAGNRLAALYAAAIERLLDLAGTAPTQVRAIGCHGQTIRHRPEHGYTLQIGNAALLAELAGIAVVSDFRSRDIAAGGQGAPLVPAFHDRILRHADIHRVVVNIGGISNLTNLPPKGAASGFDCGPGNLLMDAWCMQHTGKAYDENGEWAASGKVRPLLLEHMLAEPFFALAPPKSSGRDLFNMSWLQDRLEGSETAADVQATLLELTCRTIAQAIELHCRGAREIYLCGGGAHNQALRTRLTALLPDCTVGTTDDLGVSGDYLEAIAFAWLAQQTLENKPANLPAVTGARHPCVLGAIYPA
ncbi:anhydro-N-acetylmuramic acid kinase [Ferrigenium kumadai]|uniref:Anhydro-N-acetylmuramic acid kinase n=2 Tax=Ferrigenium kumadai TaxID=1682490 RepID=A0AAN1W0C0_9PROT|nr:anhydro-N-acetylmuramic acid kinase [Ferrigenium kumadai]